MKNGAISASSRTGFRDVGAIDSFHTALSAPTKISNFTAQSNAKPVTQNKMSSLNICSPENIEKTVKDAETTLKNIETNGRALDNAKQRASETINPEEKIMFVNAFNDLVRLMLHQLPNIGTQIENLTSILNCKLDPKTRKQLKSLLEQLKEQKIEIEKLLEGLGRNPPKASSQNFTYKARNKLKRALQTTENRLIEFSKKPVVKEAIEAVTTGASILGGAATVFEEAGKINKALNGQ